MFPESIKSIIECLLFITNEPLSSERIAEIVDIDKMEVQIIINDLREEYDKSYRGFQLLEIAKGYSLVTRPEHAIYIERLYKPQLTTLSKAALETLAIIAYRQPITRAEIELIRGVKADSAMSTLLERELIIDVGRKEGLGRPILYGTSDSFLKYFGLKNIKELPELNIFSEIENK